MSGPRATIKQFCQLVQCPPLIAYRYYLSHCTKPVRNNVKTAFLRQDSVIVITLLLLIGCESWYCEKGKKIFQLVDHKKAIFSQTSDEKSLARVEISDIEPETLEKLITFIYTDEVDDNFDIDAQLFVASGSQFQTALLNGDHTSKLDRFTHKYNRDT